MAKDPVCGMEVREGKAVESTYMGKTYYFCNKSCRRAFDSKPEYCAKR